jgi:hypothetical protein
VIHNEYEKGEAHGDGFKFEADWAGDDVVEQPGGQPMVCEQRATATPLIGLRGDGADGTAVSAVLHTGWRWQGQSVRLVGQLTRLIQMFDFRDWR